MGRQVDIATSGSLTTDSGSGGLLEKKQIIAADTVQASATYEVNTGPVHLSTREFGRMVQAWWRPLTLHCCQSPETTLRWNNIKVTK